MNFVERVTGMITSPDKAMADVAKEPRIEEALVIVAIYAIFTAIVAYIQVSHVHIEYVNSTVDMSAYGAIQSIATIVFGIIWPFILWVLVTAGLYLFSMVFGGEGKFMTVLTAIGYSNIVKIFALIIAALLLTQAPVVTMTIDMSNPLSSASSAAAAGNNIYTLLSSLVLLVGIVWSSLLGFFGIKHTEKLSARSAALVVGIPLAIYLIYRIITLAATL